MSSPHTRRWRRRLARWTAWPLMLLVRAYQVCISRWTPRTCRFEPTCSRYALRALAWHGPIKGLWLTIRRLLRCHPFGPEDPWDPVPRPHRRHSHTDREQPQRANNGR